MFKKDVSGSSLYMKEPQQLYFGVLPKLQVGDQLLYKKRIDSFFTPVEICEKSFHSTILVKLLKSYDVNDLHFRTGEELLAGADELYLNPEVPLPATRLEKILQFTP